MKESFKIVCSAGLVLIIGGLVWAMNSLVSPGDIKKMRKAKISEAIIEMLVAEQTCCVTPDFLITLKKAGIENGLLKEVILADRYKKPQKVKLSSEEIEMLKKAGCSDEIILELFNIIPVKTVVDEQGNESILYGADLPPKPEVTHPSQSPSIFNIYIDKVEP